MSDIFDLAAEEPAATYDNTARLMPELPWLNELNPEQKQAVTTTEGPLLVLSGAGTGKTKVLTARLAYILANMKANPWNCLVVTFTNRAAREMQNRARNLIGNIADSVWMGTFHGIAVKIIEKNRQRCEELGILLPKAVIINGDGTDQSLLLEEGLEYIDSFVTMTDVDEENIVLSLFAHTKSSAKIVTKVNRLNFDGVIDSLDIGTTIYPKNTTAEYVIRYVRARQNSLGSNVETLYRIIENKVEALEFIIREPSGVTDTPLEELGKNHRLRDHVLIGCIIRQGKIIIPRGSDKILVGDTVVLVSGVPGLTDIKDILRK